MRWRLLMIAGLACCNTNPLLAQTKRPTPAFPDSLQTHELTAVRVIASSHLAVDTSNTPMQQLKGRDLERINSLSVADAIRFFSGVQLKDYGGIGGLKTINVRSLGSNHTTVFYDGIELGNAQNGQVDLGKFSLDNLEEISLYQGQKSSVILPASGFASASALYLTARQPVFLPGVRSNEKISVRTGSAGLFDPSVLWQYRITGRIYSTLSAEWTTANGRYRFRETNGVYDTTAIRRNGDIDAQRIDAGLNGRFKDSSTWSVKGYVYNSQRGLPGAIVANSFGSDTARQRLWDRNFFVQASFHKEAGAYSLMVNAKYTADYTRYLDPEFVTTTGFLDNHYRERQLYLSVCQLYRITPWWNLSLSDDYRYNTLSADLYHFAYPTRNTWLNNAATEFLFPGLNIQANLLNTIVNEAVRQYAPGSRQNKWTPSILLSWKPVGDQPLRIRGFYKNIFRMPTFNDLYYTAIGSTSLRPEYAAQYDLGLTYDRIFPNQALTQLSLQADAYFNRITDKIIAVPGSNGFRWTMENLGIVYVKGLELDIQANWHPARDLSFHTGVNYTYEQSRDMDPGDNYKQQIPYTPLNSASVLASADWRRWSLNYSLIYTGYRYDESANIPVNYVQPWYTHDLTIGYALPVQCHLARTSLEVNNLFSQYYDVITNYPMPGRNYRLALQFTF